MDIKTLAFILLVGRIIALCFNVAVLRRQLRLRKEPKTLPILMKYRKIFFALNITILVVHIYPFTLDILTLFVDTGRNPTASIVGSIYGIDNNFGFLVASILIWMLYKISDTIIDLAQILAQKSPKGKLAQKLHEPIPSKSKRP